MKCAQVKWCRTRIALAGVWCCCLLACSGRSLDLDHEASPSAADPTLILEGESVQKIWVDDSRLYWVVSQPVPGPVSPLRSCLKDDCRNTRTNFASTVEDVALANGRVNWVQGTDILSCPSSGCMGSPVRIVRATPAAGPLISADADYVYWVAPSQLLRCPSSAGCGPVPQLVASGDTYLHPAFQGDDIYWSDSSTSQIRRAPKNGAGPSVTIAQTNGGARAITTSAEAVFGADVGTSAVLSCPLAGCTEAPSVVAVNVFAGSDLVVDDSSLYWLGPDPPDESTAAEPYEDIWRLRVRRRPLAGGEAVSLTPSGVRTFAVDSSSIYWSDTDLSFGVRGVNLHRIPNEVTVFL